MNDSEETGREKIRFFYHGVFDLVQIYLFACIIFTLFFGRIKLWNQGNGNFFAIGILLWIVFLPAVLRPLTLGIICFLMEKHRIKTRPFETHTSDKNVYLFRLYGPFILGVISQLLWRS